MQSSFKEMFTEARKELFRVELRNDFGEMSNFQEFGTFDEVKKKADRLYGKDDSVEYVGRDPKDKNILVYKFLYGNEKTKKFLKRLGITESNDFSKVIDVIKNIKNYSHYEGHEDGNQYALTIWNKKGEPTEIRFDKGFVKVGALKLAINPKNGVFELAKTFAKKTKDEEDYFILMDRLSTIYNKG